MFGEFEVKKKLKGKANGDEVDVFASCKALLSLAQDQQ